MTHPNPPQPPAAAGPSADWLRQQLAIGAGQLSPSDLHTLRHNALAAWHRQHAPAPAALHTATPALQAQPGHQAVASNRAQGGRGGNSGPAGAGLLLLGAALVLGMWLAAQSLRPATDPLQDLLQPDVLSQMGLNEL